LMRVVAMTLSDQFFRSERRRRSVCCCALIFCLLFRVLLDL
jgi:hypothetical protein